MRTLSRGSLKIASKSLRAHKGRSFLTMLGIIIGVSSVITVVSIGQGIKQQVAGQINHVGKDLITVRPGQPLTTQANGLKLFSSFQASSGSLSTKDLITVQNTPGVSKAVPLALVGGAIQAERGQYTAGSVLATTDQFASTLNQGMAYGAFFTEDDTEGAILGARAAAAMFNETVPLGQTFTFRGQQLIVRGVLNDFGTAPLAADVDFNNAIFIPYAAGQQLTNGTLANYEILAKPSNVQATNAVVAKLQANLLQLHGDSHDFTVLKQSDNLAATSRILDLLTELVAGAAAISLLVGGVGIMNIMLVSVTERMHEIGIRKAVGATNRQILSEFMSEAVVLSVAGVVIGVIIAAVVDIVLRLGTSLAPVMQWQVVLLAAAVSICIGILFGSAPALKAARKDPIAALRSE